MNRPDILQEAREYLRRGWSFYPTHARSKEPFWELLPVIDKPGGKRGPGWSPYQAQQPTEAEAHHWFTLAPSANLAIVTGAVSGLVIVDVDQASALQGLKDFLHANGAALPRTVCVRSRNGWHFWFQHPGEECGNVDLKTIGIPHVDIKADGGCCTAPPSIHKTGHLYRFHHAPDQFAIAPLPLPILDVLREQRRKKERPVLSGPAPIYFPGQHPYGRKVLENCLQELRSTQSGRNNTLNRTAFFLAGFIASGVLDESTVRGALQHVALEMGLTPHEIGPTISSGLADGAACPRLIPDKPLAAPAKAKRPTSLSDLRSARAGF